MAEFALQGDAVGLKAKALAVVLGVSDQTLYNYRAEGMPCIGKDTADGLERYDEADCRSWIAKNKPEPKVGGKRAGAGRKSKAQSEQQQQSEQAGDGADGAGGGAGETGNVFVEHKNQPIKIDVRSVDDILRLLRDGKLSPAQMEMLAASQKAILDHIKIEEQRGRLVDKDEIRPTITEAFANIAKALRALPSLVAVTIGAELRLDSTQCQVLRGRLVDMVEEVIVKINGDPLGEGTGHQASGISESEKPDVVA